MPCLILKKKNLHVTQKFYILHNTVPCPMNTQTMGIISISECQMKSLKGNFSYCAVCIVT